MKIQALVLCSLLSLSLSYAQTPLADSLKEVLKKTPADQKIKAYQALIIKLWLNHPDSAMVYVNQALEFSKTMDIRTKAIAVRLKGGTFYYQDQYDSAIKYNYAALKYSEQIKDTALVANSINNLGIAFYRVGIYPAALQYLLKSLKLNKHVRQTYGLVTTLNNIGLVYTELKQYDKASDFFNQAIVLARQLNDNDGLLYSLNNLAIVYLNQQKNEEAEKFLNEALTIGLKIENPIWESVTYSCFGRIALEKNNLIEAKKYFDKSLKMRGSVHGWNGISEIYFYFSKIHERSGRPDSAFFYLKKSLRIAKHIRARDRMVSDYKSIAELFVASKKYDSAFLYQSKFIALRDSLFDENLARNISDIQVQIQNDEATEKLREKDIEINSRKNQAYFIASIAFVVLIAAIGFYRSMNRERKYKGDLEQKNNEVEKQKAALQSSHEQLARANEVITRQNAELEEYNLQLQSTVDRRTKELELANKELNLVNLELDNFIYKSSHDIKGPLARLIGLCNVALLDVSDPKAKQYLTKLSETSKNLSEIFERLRTVSDINAAVLTVEKIHFTEMIKRVKSRLKVLEGFNEITFKEKIEPVEFESDPMLLETIFNNLLENAVKFQKKSTQFNKFIEIIVKRSDGTLQISFIDNGIGIQEKNDSELFSMFTNAALEHKTIGLGLYIVKQCAAKLNGNVRIVPNSNQYTEFELTLPLQS
ncbi:MAG TPA: hypothetical protein DGG95_06795 [Cytophagales bacterium]|jgi:signal transduction histidine kinase|nr:hypothetical protein [Cytophagales bacterium]